MSAYVALFRMRLIHSLQYRAAAWAGIATQFFWGFLKLMIFQAFYLSAVYAAPVPFEQIADYVWLGQAFFMMTQLAFQDNELLKSITSGNVSYELCRPYGIYPFWFSRLLALRLSSALIRAFPVLIFAMLLPEPYRLNLPANMASTLLFLLSIILAALLVAGFSMFIYLLTFLTLSPMGPRLLLGVAGEFLMGMAIPLPLMPLWLQKWLAWLPFKYMADVPFRIYSGNIAGADAVSGIIIQLVWLAVIIASGSAGFKSIQKRILVQGG